MPFPGFGALPPSIPEPHTVLRGDHICKIAKKVFHATNWKTIWYASTNQDLDDKRDNPNLLFEGDVVKAPPPTDGQASGSTQANHDFGMEKPRLFLRLRILKDDLKPLADAPYELKIAGETVSPTLPPEELLKNPRTGNTDSNGVIQTEIHLDAEKASLTLRIPAEPKKDKTGAVIGDAPVTWDLWIGALHALHPDAPGEDEAKYLPGIRQRLHNLGINAGPIDGPMNDATKAAIKTFCSEFGLPVSDKPDETFQRKLKEVHDQPPSSAQPPPPTKKKGKKK